MTGGDGHGPDPEGPGDAKLDLAAILRSEQALSELSERRGPDDAEEPLALLAALAADVDDAPDALGALGDLPGEEPATGTGSAPRHRRGRGGRWTAAAAGLAAAIVGTTGVATANTHVLSPISGLFARPSPSSTAAAPEGTTSGGTATGPATGTEGTSRTPAPGRAPNDPGTTRYAPGDESGGAPLATPKKSANPSSTAPSAASPKAASPRPTASPTDRDDVPTASPTGEPTARPKPSHSPGHRREGLKRLDHAIDRLIGTRHQGS